MMLVFYYPEREQPRPRKGARRFRRSPDPMIVLSPGRNLLQDDELPAIEKDPIWEILKANDAIKFKQHDSDAQEVDESVPATGNSQPEPEPETKPTVEYFPLEPTTEQLLPVDGIGPVKASSIIANTPEGGYDSPTQMIELNSLSLAIELIEPLFEIV